MIWADPVGLPEKSVAADTSTGDRILCAAATDPLAPRTPRVIVTPSDAIDAIVLHSCSILTVMPTAADVPEVSLMVRSAAVAATASVVLSVIAIRKHLRRRRRPNPADTRATRRSNPVG